VRAGRPEKNAERISAFTTDTAAKTGLSDRTIRPARYARPVGVVRKGDRWIIRWLEGSGPERVYRQLKIPTRNEDRTPVTYDDAKDLWKAKVAEAVSRRRGPGPRPRFAALAARYQEVHGPELSASWRKRVDGILRDHLAPRFGPARCEDLTAGDIVRYRNDRKADGASNATINREVTLLLAILGFGEAEGWLDRTPIPRKRVRPLPERVVETFFLPEEWQKLRAAFDDRETWERHRAKVRTFGPVVADARAPRGTGRRHGAGLKPDGDASHAYRERLRKAIDVLEAVLLTGSRLGEIIGLTWDAVDLKRGRVTIWQPKVGRAKVLPITPELRALLEAQPRGIGKTPVFRRPDPPRRPGQPAPKPAPWDKAKLERAFRLARKLAKIRPELRIHDLRHAAASWATAGGASDRHVRDLLGHTSVSMSARYSHVRPEDLAGAAGIVSRLASGDAKSDAERPVRKRRSGSKPHE